MLEKSYRNFQLWTEEGLAQEYAAYPASRNSAGFTLSLAFWSLLKCDAWWRYDILRISQQTDDSLLLTISIQLVASVDWGYWTSSGYDILHSRNLQCRSPLHWEWQDKEMELKGGWFRKGRIWLSYELALVRNRSREADRGDWHHWD